MSTSVLVDKEGWMSNEQIVNDPDFSLENNYIKFIFDCGNTVMPNIFYSCFISDTNY